MYDVSLFLFCKKIRDNKELLIILLLIDSFGFSYIASFYDIVKYFYSQLHLFVFALIVPDED